MALPTAKERLGYELGGTVELARSMMGVVMSTPVTVPLVTILERPAVMVPGPQPTSRIAVLGLRCGRR